MSLGLRWEVGDEAWSKLPYHKRQVYADPGRHYQRVAAAVHQLAQLAALPDLLYGDYQSLFVEPPRWAGKFLAGGTWFSPLAPDCWPEEPIAPPFLVRARRKVYSPVPLEGLRQLHLADGMCIGPGALKPVCQWQ